MKGAGPDGENSITSSEAHGYGMLILSLLSDEIPNSKKLFYGMYKFYESHPSLNNPLNMSWIVHKSKTKKYASATDGDLDIAYALLIAHKKWGSYKNTNYKNKAINMINHGIKKSDLTKNRVTLGDWDTNIFHSRPSDWMPLYFKTFYNQTGDSFWLDHYNQVYSSILKIQKEHSPRTGLIPDFVISQKLHPAPKNYLNEKTNDFSWNACRVPLRLVLDYDINNNAKSKRALSKIMDWMTSQTKNNPKSIKSGYSLKGVPHNNYASSSFIAPIIAASTIDKKYQAYLNKGWDHLVVTKTNYYDDTLTLITLSYLTNHWKRI